MEPHCPFLIIGNSAAAVGAITGIREVDPQTPITLIAKEPQHTYSRPLISYLLGGKVDESKMPYRSPAFYAENKITPILGSEVIRVDPENHFVQAKNGERYGFGKLLIATGGNPIVPRDIEGIQSQGVFTFTTWDDAQNIQSHIERCGVRRALIVGGGLIGLKSLEALMALGIQTTLVELSPRVLSVTFDQTASNMAQETLRKNGAEIHCNTTVQSIQSDQGNVISATLKSGIRIDCELVIIAIGVLPNIDLVKNTAIKTDRGIVVDGTLQSTVEGIYAAGDVAQAFDLVEGGTRPIPILPVAYRQGWVAGLNMAGRRRLYRGGVAMNAVDVCGLPTISVGITVPATNEYEILSSLESSVPRYRKIVLRDNRIVGFILIGDIDRAGILTGLIRDKIDVTSFKESLLTDDFGLLHVPKDYRKHIVSGMGIEV